MQNVLEPQNHNPRLNVISANAHDTHQPETLSYRVCQGYMGVSMSKGCLTINIPWTHGDSMAHCETWSPDVGAIAMGVVRDALPIRLCLP